MTSYDPTADGWEITEPGGLPEFLRPMWTKPDATGFSLGFMTNQGLTNGRNVIHGGMLATYMDHALGRTVREAVDRVPIATIQLDLHYLAPALADRFVAVRGEITRRTSSVVFIRGMMTMGEANIMSANGVWKILAAKKV
jgi:acyl-coenzyme A thioesterase PaaI-like protein